MAFLQRDETSAGGYFAHVAMVGRDVELGVLRDAYTDVVDAGHARVVNVVGDAGIGKSCLLDELNEWIDQRSDDTRVFRGRSVADGLSMPLTGLRSMVSDRFGIRNDDTVAELAAKVQIGMRSLTSAQAEVLGHWLGFELDQSPAVRDVAGSPGFATIALGHLMVQIRSLLDDAPVVLLLEDLQWSDSESLDVIGHLVDAFVHRPLLVVCAARPSLFERRAGWSAGPQDATVTVELTELDDASRHAHVRGLLRPAEDLPSGFVELLAGHARGNPLYAQALVALAIDRGVITAGSRPWTVDPVLSGRFDPPDGLTEVIQARLEHLTADQTAVLGHASIIGRSFWDDTLVAAALTTESGPRTHAEVLATLAELEARSLVRPRPWSLFTGCREYEFAHSMLRVESDGLVDAASRALVHRSAARWLEQHSGDRVSENAGVLADQMTRAGELDRAADLLHEAGARSSATGATQSALAFYQRSLHCRETTDNGHGPAATSTRIELAHLLASAGRNDEAMATYRTAESDAARSGSRRLAANAMAGALRTAAARGDWPEAEGLVERVQPLAELFGGEVRARYLSGRALLLMDGPRQDLDEAKRLIVEAVGIWRRLEHPSSELRTLNELGLVNTKMGHSSEADGCYDEALAIARRIGDTSGEWMLLQNRAVLAHLEARAGRIEYPRVLELYGASLERRRRLGLPHNLVLANLAQAEIEAGRLVEGRRNATEALRVGWMRHDRLDWTIALIAHAQAAFAEGRHAEAFSILGSLLAERRAPTLEGEIHAVLDHHGIDRSTVADAMTEAAGDLTAVVSGLLGES